MAFFSACSTPFDWMSLGYCLVGSPAIHLLGCLLPNTNVVRAMGSWVIGKNIHGWNSWTFWQHGQQFALQWRCRADATSWWRIRIDLHYLLSHILIIFCKCARSLINMLVCLIDNKKYSGGLFALEHVPDDFGVENTGTWTANIVATAGTIKQIIASHTCPGGWQILATGAASLLWPSQMCTCPRRDYFERMGLVVSNYIYICIKKHLPLFLNTPQASGYLQRV